MPRHLGFWCMSHDREGSLDSYSLMLQHMALRPADLREQTCFRLVAHANCKNDWEYGCGVAAVHRRGVSNHMGSCTFSLRLLLFRICNREAYWMNLPNLGSPTVSDRRGGKPNRSVKQQQQPGNTLLRKSCSGHIEHPCANICCPVMSKKSPRTVPKQAPMSQRIHSVTKQTHHHQNPTQRLQASYPIAI